MVGPNLAPGYVIIYLFFSHITVIVLYTSEKRGNDETGVGTEDKPFKTILQVTTPPSLYQTSILLVLSL